MNAKQTTPNLLTTSKAPSPAPIRFGRRALFLGASAAFAGMVVYPKVKHALRASASVFVARHQRYDGPLAQTIRDGLLATGIDPVAMHGKRVLLKPNLVEPTKKSPQLTTHPAMILAAAEVFRGWGSHVIVGEGPGHVRDTEMALAESGVQEALDAAELDFSDLNYEEVAWVINRGQASKLPGFFFPRSVVEADLIVSLPKMKTHHWVGFTSALKNLYGVIPGIKYGWPKNVLHYAGIPQTVFDINASLPKTIAIVDGILAMEGDGPIMGSAKPMGLVIVSTNPTAADATVARIMGLDPTRVNYMQLAGNQLGPTDEAAIIQRGEQWQAVASDFKIIDEPFLQELRIRPGQLMSQSPARKKCRRAGGIATTGHITA